MSDLLIRNLGGAATGRIDEPFLELESLSVVDGRIEELGTSADSDRVIDAGGRWAMPGLWDGSFRLYFGDHEPTYSARGAVAAAVAFGVTTIVAGVTPAVAGWSPEPRPDRELAILTARSWRHDRPSGIKVSTHVARANRAWGPDDFAALREGGTTTLTASVAADDGETRDLAAIAREHGLAIGLLLDAAGGGTPDALIADLRPSFVVLQSPDPALVETAEHVLDGSTASLGVTLTAGPTALVRLVRSARERSALARIFLGTGLPAAPGVLPAGVPLMVEILASSGVVTGPQAIALAAGNVAAAYGLDGGTLQGGAPADLSLAFAADGSPDWARPRWLTLIDGADAWAAEPSAVTSATAGGAA